MSQPRRGRPRAFHDKTEQNTVRALDRGLGVLAELARGGGATLSELAERLAEPAPSLYRALITLEGHGMAELDPATQHWHVGAGAFRVGSAFLRRTSLLERARPEMHALMAATGETANLGVARGTAVLFIGQVETHETIRAFFPPGTESPLHASGIGKALLAFLPEARRTALLDRLDLTRFTPATLADRAALEADLAAIRTRGFAVDDEERTAGMRCVAAPVFDAMGEAVAGLSVSGPVSRMSPERAAAMAAEVRAAAARLSVALGYSASGTVKT